MSQKAISNKYCCFELFYSSMDDEKYIMVSSNILNSTIGLIINNYKMKCFLIRKSAYYKDF